MYVSSRDGNVDRGNAIDIELILILSTGNLTYSWLREAQEKERKLGL